jgi:hypothetical protein
MRFLPQRGGGSQQPLADSLVPAKLFFDSALNLEGLGQPHAKRRGIGALLNWSSHRTTWRQKFSTAVVACQGQKKREMAQFARTGSYQGIASAVP